jgi:hypothetical protein
LDVADALMRIDEPDPGVRASKTLRGRELQAESVERKIACSLRATPGFRADGDRARGRRLLRPGKEPGHRRPSRLHPVRIDSLHPIFRPTL